MVIKSIKGYCDGWYYHNIDKTFLWNTGIYANDPREAALYGIPTVFASKTEDDECEVEITIKIKKPGIK